MDKISILTQRENERQLCLKKRKDDKEQSSAENEKLEYFMQTFNEKKLHIERALEKSDQISPKQLADHFNEISKEILVLQKYVAASNIFLRSYDIKKCNENIHDLTNRAKDLEEKLLPKKKFGFKNKTKQVVKTVENSGNGHTNDEVDFTKRIVDSFCGFTDKNNEVLVLSGEEIFRKDITCQNLNNCTVKLFGNPSTLLFSHLNNCHVFCGPVTTSIFAENCENCTFVIACQQLRLHSSKNINIYLHVTCRAIMEDSNHVFLAPYNLKYPGLDKDFSESGLDLGTNHWDSVDDFNWLNAEKHSPNWAVLEENDRVKNWDSYLR